MMRGHRKLIALFRLLFLLPRCSGSDRKTRRTILEADNSNQNLQQRYGSNHLFGASRIFNQQRVAKEPYSTFHDPLKNLFHPRTGEGFENSSECDLNIDGYYGRQIGDEYSIDFLYQIHVAPNIRLSAFNVLALEEAMVVSILPDFFDCDEGLPLTSIQSIDWHPADHVIGSGLTCDSDKIIADLDCYVVQGMLTVHAVGMNERIVIEPMLSSLESNIGSLTTSVIQHVDYIGETLFDLVPTLYYEALSVRVPPPLGFPSSSPSNTLFPTRRPFPGDTEAPSIDSRPTTTTEPSILVDTSVPTPVMPTLPSVPIASIVPTPNIITVPTPETTQQTPTLSPTVITEIPTVAPSRILLSSLKPSVTSYPTQTMAPSSIPTITQKPTVTVIPSTLSPIGSDTTEESANARGIEVVEWWGWLLVAVGGIMIVLMTLVLMRLNEFHTERKLRIVQPENSSGSSSNYGGGGVLTKMEQARQQYIPPGLNTNHGLIPSIR